MDKIFASYVKTDSFYEFVDEKGNKSIYSIPAVIMIEDDSDYITFKLTASRKIIGIVKK